jgi:EpsG family
MITLNGFLWLSSHLLFGLYIFAKRWLKFILALIFILNIYIYTTKPDTYDLAWYLPYFENPFPMEPLFYSASLYLKNTFMLNARSILLFWQIITITLIYFAVITIFKKNRLLFIPIILSSLFCILTTQNGLRQGVALSILLFGYSLFMFPTSKKYLLFFIFVVIATLVHTATPLFATSLILFLLANKYCLSLKSIFCVGGGFGLSLYFFAAEYGGTYGDTSIDWGNERSSSFVKMVAILISFLLTTNFKNKNPLIDFFSRLRFFNLIVLLGLTFSGEIFARYAYFYYLIELLYSVSLLSKGASINRLHFCMIFCFYGIAPNAINVITKYN